jgi:hypothetical protein
MADTALVRMLAGDDAHAGYAGTIKTHDLIHDGEILLTIHGRPVLIACDFADDLDGEDEDRQVLLTLNPQSLVGIDDRMDPVRLPQRFVIPVPPVITPTVVVEAPPLT